MRAVTEEEIRLRAYELWQLDGSPSGKDDEYWIRAEQELCGAMPTDTCTEPDESDAPKDHSNEDVVPPKKTRR